MSGSQIPYKTKHDTVDVGYFSHPNVPSEVSIEISGDEDFMISHFRVSPLYQQMSCWLQKNEPSSTIVTLYTLWISRKICNSCIKKSGKDMENSNQKSNSNTKRLLQLSLQLPPSPFQLSNHNSSSYGKTPHSQHIRHCIFDLSDISVFLFSYTNSISGHARYHSLDRVIRYRCSQYPEDHHIQYNDRERIDRHLSRCFTRHRLQANNEYRKRLSPILSDIFYSSMREYTYIFCSALSSIFETPRTISHHTQDTSRRAHYDVHPLISRIIPPDVIYAHL